MHIYTVFLEQSSSVWWKVVVTLYIHWQESLPLVGFPAMGCDTLHPSLVACLLTCLKNFFHSIGFTAYLPLSSASPHTTQGTPHTLTPHSAPLTLTPHTHTSPITPRCPQTSPIRTYVCSPLPQCSAQRGQRQAHCHC